MKVIGGQVLIVFIGGAAFETTPIPASYWAISVALGAGSLLVGCLVRFIPDGPLGEAMIRLRIIPDLNSLPRTRPKDDDNEDAKTKPFACKSFFR